MFGTVRRGARKLKRTRKASMARYVMKMSSGTFRRDTTPPPPFPPFFAVCLVVGEGGGGERGEGAKMFWAVFGKQIALLVYISWYLSCRWPIQNRPGPSFRAFLFRT